MCSQEKLSSDHVMYAISAFYAHTGIIAMLNKLSIELSYDTSIGV